MSYVSGACLVLGVGLGVLASGARLDELPPAVARTAETYLAGQQPTHWALEAEDGVPVYEISWSADDRLHEIMLTEAGELVEQDEMVPASEVPVAVRSAAAAALGGELTFERKLVVRYEAHMLADGIEHEAVFAATGQPVHDPSDGAAEDDDGDDDDDG